MKTGIFVLALAVAAAGQFFLPQLWSTLAYLDFFLLVAFHTGRQTGANRAIGAGFIAGLIQDLLMTGSYPLGIQAIPKMITGGLAYLTGRNFNTDHPVIQAALVLGLSLLNHLLVIGLFVIFGQECPSGGLWPALFGAALTTLFNFPAGLLAAPRRRIRLP